MELNEMDADVLMLADCECVAVWEPVGCDLVIVSVCDADDEKDSVLLRDRVSEKESEYV